ncbi:rho GTPase-activating protein 21 [Lutzomyia longipalpis]|uniref:rho GTPase-activating protein 21 n=1 Tax=Lutzomyia longipalpis TaxID=7200 RepID=UPI002483A348|nr:rho GTPase-activating protein 21 [Lutzomyia longipalpis]XP_055683360.1 rho GTPase-activating protein 21 [Lutzomyia longipalpis]XP_055683361.1 rho GTPase-activating protein 21 [Lutzomyia longipalpis]XP_055683362.1 rho GTPase-activating protein 21 [Lutzomyia longipalpis]
MADRIGIVASRSSGGGGAALKQSHQNCSGSDKQRQLINMPPKPNQLIRPKTVVIRRQENHGFGFTLRHFIVYPPDANEPVRTDHPTFQVTEPMDTVFVKEVRPNGPAHVAGLQTGDRLLTVNGIAIGGMPYAHVISIIQQIPSILTLQVVPKECDVLQTFFSETAHNPETNQRPRVSNHPTDAGLSSSSYHPTRQSYPAGSYDPQMHFHTYQPPGQSTSLYRSHEPSEVVYNPLYSGDGGKGTNRRESQLSTVSSTTVSSYDSQATNSTTSTIKELTDNAIMMRLKKTFEQKEEFLRRPNQQPLFSWVSPPPSLEVSTPKLADGSVKQREFYARPKKMQKQVWPPQSATNSPNSSGQFDGGIAAALAPKEDLTIQLGKQSYAKYDENSIPGKCDRRPSSGQMNHFIPIQNNKENEVSHVQEHKKLAREQFFAQDDSRAKDEYAMVSHPGLHIVSERTKMFESGRPLSPDGNFLDRTQLYKSELSRLNNKVAVPNVAHRKKEFESLEERDRSVSLDHSDLSRRLPRNGHVPSDRDSTSSPYKSADMVSERGDVVTMRPTTKCAISLDDEERRVRRISYLRATANEGSLHSDQATDTTSYSSMPSDVLDDDKSPSLPSTRRSSQRVSEDLGILLYPGARRDSNLLDVVGGEAHHAGNLQVKITLIDGKRSHDRSWKNIWAELVGHKLKMMIQREGKPNQNLGILDLKNFTVADANYTKRKHVFKLISIPPTHVTTFSPLGPTELLLQAENDYDMNLWRDLLQCVCDPEMLLKKECVVGDVGGQIAEPQSVAAVKTIQTPSATSDESSGAKSVSSSKKYYLGSRSPSGQSPVTKSRKTPQQLNITLPTASSGSGGQKDLSDKEGGSPKPKTWKGLVARQLRKIQGQPTAGQGSYPAFPEGASIGVPLSHCVPSEENEFVPLLVARCTSIVEQKGLDIVGIYRIPGNTAAITALTDQVNRGFDEATLTDAKWEDVNVVSSLLKSFIRNLPEPLLPNDIYANFILADKKSGRLRMSELKNLLETLPPFSYETMKHLLRHLHRVSQNCLVNLMEPKNLAIIFGPSIVRSSNETLETAVKDMKHQCRIVESLVTHYGYFFERDPIPDVAELPTPTEANKELDAPTTNLLLDNVAKIEPFKEKEYSSRFVASIVQAANRKIRKSTTRKTVLSTGTPDNLSLDSNTSTESKDTASALQHMEPKELESLKHRLSEDDSNDSTFVENGSMSLTTVTIALDNKLKSLRCSLDSSTQDSSEVDAPLRSQALSLGDNLPYADESPERSLLSVKMKPLPIPTKHKVPSNLNAKKDIDGTTASTGGGKAVDDDATSSSSSTTSGDTDTSTTSIPIHIDSEVLRKMNRILTNLERNTTKMNRSLSLNYKSQQKGGECCCHVNHRVINRVPLTKDEKTDKNINKKRHSQETKGHHHRRYDNRSIRRRHTVGGTHDYSPKYIERTGNTPMDNYSTPCRNYVMRRSSSPE